MPLPPGAPSAPARPPARPESARSPPAPGPGRRERPECLRRPGARVLGRPRSAPRSRSALSPRLACDGGSLRRAEAGPGSAERSVWGGSRLRSRPGSVGNPRPSVRPESPDTLPAAPEAASRVPGTRFIRKELPPLRRGHGRALLLLLLLLPAGKGTRGPARRAPAEAQPSPSEWGSGKP